MMIVITHYKRITVFHIKIGFVVNFANLIFLPQLDLDVGNSPSVRLSYIQINNI